MYNVIGYHHAVPFLYTPPRMKSETENATQATPQTTTPAPAYTTPQWTSTSRTLILKECSTKEVLTNFFVTRNPNRSGAPATTAHVNILSYPRPQVCVETITNIGRRRINTIKRTRLIILRPPTGTISRTIHKSLSLLLLLLRPHNVQHQHQPRQIVEAWTRQTSPL